MGTSSKNLASRLQALTARQHGFFTAAQAESIGYVDSVHLYHVHNGDWIRVQRGIYKLADFAPSAWDYVMQWALWSRSKRGQMQGIYCRETALAIHEGRPPAEGRLQMIVPVKFRKGTPIPAHILLFKSALAEGDVTQINAIPVTTLARTMADVKAQAEPGPVPPPAPVSTPVAEAPRTYEDWWDWQPSDALRKQLNKAFDPGID